jgi:6-phosphogluconolactonase (cycloisomerase 2 family)
VGVAVKKGFAHGVPIRLGQARGAVSLLFAAGFFLGVIAYPAADAAGSQSQPNYTDQVEPVIQNKCLGCHNNSSKMGGLIMETYDSLMKGGQHGPVIAPGKSSDSRMILMLEGKIQPRMPFGSEPLPPAVIATLKAWIDAGASGPLPGAAATRAAPTPVIPEIKPTVPTLSPVTSLAFAPDSRVLALGGYKEVRLMDAASGKALAKLSGHADEVRALAFSPDGKWLAAAGGLPARSGEIRIWDVESHQLLRTLEGHKDCIYSVAVSPDGKLIASASYDKLIKLWDAQTGKELRTLKDHIDAVFAVTFSPDGKRLASGAQDRTVKIWDVATGQRLFTLSEALDAVTTVAFSPDGSHLAAAGLDKLIRIYDLSEKSGSLAQSMIAHEDAILRVVYSPDGKTLISTSADRTIRVWDTAMLAAVKVFENQPDWVEAMTVSPDGKWLAAGRYDGSVSVYNLRTNEQVLGPIPAFETYRAATLTDSPRADRGPLRISHDHQ